MGSFHLLWPDRTEMSRFGFDGVAHVPFVLSGDRKYHDEASWYLRERAMLEWPDDDSDERALAQRYPTVKSLGTYGNSLINFLEWCEEAGPAWREVRYTEDIVQRYQDMMLQGHWSRDGEPLKASTVNLRVSEACNFLRWAADRSLRPPFRVRGRIGGYRQGQAAARKHQHASVAASRAGRIRPDPQELRIPTPSEVAEWLSAVYIKYGHTKGLLCESILTTAIRREEAVQWRLDTLPPSTDIIRLDGAGQVKVTITYGAKGPKRRDKNGDERGPARQVFVQSEFAKKLDHYRAYVRPATLAAYVREATSKADRLLRLKSHKNRLFLSEDTGLPISAGSLYTAWTGSSRLPYAGWSPHLGRHYWACTELLRQIKLQMKAQGLRGPSQTGVAWIEGNAKALIQLIIQPQLGHLNEATTNSYLGWLRQVFPLIEISDAWATELEGDAQ